MLKDEEMPVFGVEVARETEKMSIGRGEEGSPVSQAAPALDSSVVSPQVWELVPLPCQLPAPCPGVTPDPLRIHLLCIYVHVNFFFIPGIVCIGGAVRGGSKHPFGKHSRQERS